MNATESSKPDPPLDEPERVAVDATRNRWLVALCGVGVHLSIGSVYAYSVMTLPLKEAVGWGKTDITTAFAVAIAFLGCSAAFLGPSVEKHGPRAAGIFSACFYGTGTLIAGLGVHQQSLAVFVLGYGVIGGIGLGVGYITPVSTLVKWFPDKRGLATGMAIMGFGFSAMVFGPVMAALFNAPGVSAAATFWALGSVYFVLIFGSALYLAPPPAGWVPDHLRVAGSAPGTAAKPKRVQRDLAQCLVGEALRTRRFYYMWVLMFINITCGIGLIAVASPMAQDAAGFSVAGAATLVGLMGVLNGLGRFGWASASDFLGRPGTYAAFFVIQIIAFTLLASGPPAWAFTLLILLIITCYGGGFATLPAFLGDLFGTKRLGAIHGATLTAWSAAGLVGPVLVTRVQEATGSYASTLYLFAGLFVIALIVTGLMALDIRSKRAIPPTRAVPPIAASASPIPATRSA